MDAREAEARLYALRKGGDCLEAALDNPVALQAQILEILLDLIPAKRGAILLNGPRVSPDLKDFESGTYGQRGGGLTEGFEINGKVIDFVYSKKEACMSNDAMPAIMCAPLILPNQTIIGVIYLDTCEFDSFEMADLGVLRTISRSVAKLIHGAIEGEVDLIAEDLYRQLFNREPRQED